MLHSAKKKAFLSDTPKGKTQFALYFLKQRVKNFLIFPPFVAYLIVYHKIEHLDRKFVTKMTYL